MTNHYTIVLEGSSKGIERMRLEGTIPADVTPIASAVCTILEASGADWDSVCYLSDQIRKRMRNKMISRKGGRS